MICIETFRSAPKEPRTLAPVQEAPERPPQERPSPPRSPPLGGFNSLGFFGEATGHSSACGSTDRGTASMGLATSRLNVPQERISKALKAFSRDSLPGCLRIGTRTCRADWILKSKAHFRPQMPLQQMYAAATALSAWLILAQRCS